MEQSSYQPMKKLFSETEQNQANQFIKSIFNEVMERRSVSTQQIFEPTSQQDQRQFVDKENSGSINVSDTQSLHFAGKFPVTQKPSILRKSQKKMHHHVFSGPQPQYNETYLSPIDKNLFSDLVSNSLSRSPLCNSCKQMETNSHCDNEKQKKNKNMGFYNYNFIYVMGKQKIKEADNADGNEKERKSNSPLQNKEILKRAEVLPPESSKKQNLKQSAGNLQSFDFELSVSQKGSNLFQKGKERQFSEICSSQIVSQDIQQASGQKYNLLKQSGLMDQINLANSISTFRSEPNAPQQSQKQDQFKSSLASSNIEKLKSNLKQLSTQEKAQIAKFFEQECKPEQINKPVKQLAELKKLIPPEDKKIYQNQKSIIQREYFAEPLELVNSQTKSYSILDSHMRVLTMTDSQQTPLTKYLDQLEISDIQLNSKRHSPTNTFQLNLLEVFEKEIPKSRNKESQPQRLIKRVQDQIATLKSNLKPIVLPSKSRPPSQQKYIKKNPSEPTLYQKVLFGKKK